MEVLYVILAVAVAAAAYFLFLRPSGAEKAAFPESKSSPELKSVNQADREAAAISASADRHSAKVGITPAHEEDENAAPSAAAPASTPADQVPSDSSISLRPAAPTSIEPTKTTSGPPSVLHVRNVEGLRRGLEKTRAKEGFFGRLLSVFAGKKDIDQDIAAQIEEVLLASDVGVKTTATLLARVKDQLHKGELASAESVWAALREEALKILAVDGHPGAFKLRAKPTVVLMVGVNGAGKTTTIGKLATRLKGEGLQVVLAAADTFRAAAVQQLVVWGNRVGVEVVKGKDGADPGSVIFEAVQRAKQTGADVVLADTAGRLHTKANLMAELAKVVKTTGKALDGAPHEILLVLDATNGQNAMAQATEFQQALALTGVVLTKLDGTAKGGMVLGICDTLKLPVRYVGLGETANDLHDFDPEEFVEALLGQEETQS